ncbi:hypothetical protein JZO76_00200 [Enterococcus sp. MJM12]|uniref:Uncharacterized protein n=1 Tax=Candidatus Enterococcus myersii TaxID=2815322 RepID=A0ABS3H3G1_9ENTE|nr:hypothetical protein [Enterococcus sp. MJM12]MBO0447949.1 hypothetical protein [Enterococcus sp. MJM12]
MRLRKRELQTVWLKHRKVTSDDEGNDVITFPSEPIKLEMNVQSAGGQIMAQIYGESLPYIKTCKYQGDLLKVGQNEKDCICMYVSKDKDPDYEVVAIQPFSTHLNITLKKRGTEHGS